MTVLALTCLRNEAPYVVDWVAHHRALGFDRFLVFSHDCEDGSDRLLDALAGAGVVVHEPFEPAGKRTVQWQALDRMNAHPLLAEADWALFFDVDEYLNLPEGMETVAALLSEEADAIALPWRLFGSGGHVGFSPEPVTARFSMAAPPDLPYPLAHLFKTLHRPSAFARLGVHRPRQRKGELPRWRIGNGTPVVGGVERNEKAITLFGQPGLRRGRYPVLNHYSVRSAEEFLLKRQRGLPNHMDRPIDLAYWAERNWNVVEDVSIRRFDARVARERASLMALPGVAAAHEAGVAWHREQIARLRQPLENVRLLWHLALLAGSTPPTPEMARAYIAAQREARGNG